MTKTSSKYESAQTELDESTYFDRERLLRICSFCDALSYFALGMAVLVVVYGLWMLLRSISSMWRISLEAIVGEAGIIALLIGIVALLCLFFWVFLRAISEGLYLLMDIQDNTRATRQK